MAEFFIDIEPNGDVTVDGGDHTGPECEKLTEAIEQALGVVTAKKFKQEYHRPKPVLRKVGA